MEGETRNNAFKLHIKFFIYKQYLMLTDEGFVDTT